MKSPVWDGTHAVLERDVLLTIAEVAMTGDAKKGVNALVKKWTTTGSAGSYLDLTYMQQLCDTFQPRPLDWYKKQDEAMAFNYHEHSLPKAVANGSALQSTPIPPLLTDKSESDDYHTSLEFCKSIQESLEKLKWRAPTMEKDGFQEIQPHEATSSQFQKRPGRRSIFSVEQAKHIIPSLQATIPPPLTILSSNPTQPAANQHPEDEKPFSTNPTPAPTTQPSSAQNALPEPGLNPPSANNSPSVSPPPTLQPDSNAEVKSQELTVEVDLETEQVNDSDAREVSESQAPLPTSLSVATPSPSTANPDQEATLTSGPQCTTPHLSPPPNPPALESLETQPVNAPLQANEKERPLFFPSQPSQSQPHIDSTAEDKTPPNSLDTGLQDECFGHSNDLSSLTALPESLSPLRTSQDPGPNISDTLSAQRVPEPRKSRGKRKRASDMVLVDGKAADDRVLGQPAKKKRLQTKAKNIDYPSPAFVPSSPTHHPAPAPKSSLRRGDRPSFPRTPSPHPVPTSPLACPPVPPSLPSSSPPSSPGSLAGSMQNPHFTELQEGTSQDDYIESDDSYTLFPFVDVKNQDVYNEPCLENLNPLALTVCFPF